MKRLYFSFVVCLFVLSSCFGGAAEVEFLSFYSNDVTELRIIPDYEIKSLYVEYFQNDELVSDGDVGNKYFDRFEKLIKIVSKSEFSVAVGEDFEEEEMVFGIYFVRSDGRGFVVDTLDHFGEKDFSFVQSFYLDLLNLLTQDVPV